MKRLLLFTVVATLFSACVKDITENRPGIESSADEAPETLTVGFEDDVETRIQLNESQKTVWTNGDLVSVFYRSDANQKWQYKGETGARVADLTRIDEGVAGESMKRVVVVYPYNKNYYINTETYNIQATLPAVQTYMKDSYGLDGNIMISSGEYNDISLKSVCGWLKLQMTGNGQIVESITLKGNNGEQVAGELYINSADATATLASAAGDSDDGQTGGLGGGLVFEDKIIKEVKLDCGEGIELGAEATAFYIALPPQTFEKGFTVEIECAEHLTYTKSTDKSLTIERNHIHPMTAFKYDGVKIHPDNQIWYTSSDNNAVTPYPYASDPFDANIVSNTYNAEKKCWVLSFDKDITKIGETAFCDCSRLTSITIPDRVSTIEERAFAGCSNLTDVAIPDGLKMIGERAFHSCTSLEKINLPEGLSTINIETFYCCESLKSIIIPDSVTYIGYYAFQDCSALQDVTIGNSVKTIANYAFDRCKALQSITIPESVTTMGYGAFRDCSSLKDVYCHPSIPPVLNNEYVFYNNASGRKIYVRISALDDYMEAPSWSGYTNSIKEDYTPVECTDLKIEADDVPGYMTSTTIRYNATTNGMSFNRYIIEDIVITGEDTSGQFDVNPSLTESVERTISYSYLGKTATTTIIQGPSLPKSYTVDLGDRWQISSIPNPDPELYDGVYESTNHSKRSSSYMYIDIVGYSDFTIYVRNDAEDEYDYTTIWLDSESVKTVAYRNSDTSLSSYTKITFNDIDKGPHKISIRFKKDDEVDVGADCSYVLIPKNQ